MNIRRTRFRLSVLAAALTIASAAIVVSSVVMPLRAVGAAKTTTIRRPAGPTTARSTTLPSFEGLEDLNLRWDLSATGASSSATRPTTASDAPDLRLVGTIYEAGHAYAIFVTPAGQTLVKGVGQLAGAAQITEIAETRVTMLQDGHAIVLKLDRPGVAPIP